MFVLPFYVVFAVAFGSVDKVFRLPVPYYAPWWWSFGTFNQTLTKFYEYPHIYQDPLIRTFEYVIAASVISHSSHSRAASSACRVARSVSPVA